MIVLVRVKKSTKTFPHVIRKRIAFLYALTKVCMMTLLSTESTHDSFYDVWTLLNKNVYINTHALFRGSVAPTFPLAFMWCKKS